LYGLGDFYFGDLSRSEAWKRGAMRRRQPGILTGMPFMANLADRSFVDDLGRKIYLAKPARRIISLAPSVTEILFAVGLDAEIVGVTTFCDYPPQAKSKPKIGSSIPNLEAILGLKPDLVIGNQDFIRPDVLAKLDQLRVPVFLLAPKTIEDILGHIHTVGRLVGHEKDARFVVDGVRERLTEIRYRMAPVRRVRVFYVINSDPLISVGPASFIHQMLEAAGGENIAARTTAAYPKVSLEEVIRKDPEVIVFPVGTTEGIPDSEQQQWRKWKTLSAVSQDRLYQVKAELVNRPGPRVIDGVQLLARLLHPDLFPATQS
jgi:iron complex transport system substrate-binding protein